MLCFVRDIRDDGSGSGSELLDLADWVPLELAAQAHWWVGWEFPTCRNILCVNDMPRFPPVREEFCEFASFQIVSDEGANFADRCFGSTVHTVFTARPLENVTEASTRSCLLCR